MAAVSKEEYLKRYLSTSDAKKKKKRKKVVVKTEVKTIPGQIRIVDDDVDFSSLLPDNLENTLDEDTNRTQEDEPVVCDEDEVKTLADKELDKRMKDERWKALQAIDLTKDEVELDSDSSPPRKSDKRSPRQRDSLQKHSPLRIKIKQEPVSPPRRKRHDSDSSPPRRKRHDSDSSPPRRKRHDSDSSPPRRKRHDSDSSPPRRKRHDSDSSPPRRKRHDSDSSPPRRKRHDSDSSPPRRKRHDSDSSPPRRKRHDSDSSPPRRKRHDSDSSPPRRKRHDSDSSPPRRKRHDSDSSPPRRRIKPDPDAAVSVKKEPTDKGYPGEGEGSDVPRTLKGEKAGLSTAQEMRDEAARRKIKKENDTSHISDEALGKGAATVVRRHVRERDEEKMRKKKEKEEKQKVRDEKYKVWGRGVANEKQKAEKLEEAIHEASKPLARYRDDEDMDAMLKAVDREGDTMAAYMAKKKKKKQVQEAQATGRKIKERPQYSGWAPPNRFGIKPGYRWDGVDRSTGFEKELLLNINSRKARDSEAYQWSVSDM